MTNVKTLLILAVVTFVGIPKPSLFQQSSEIVLFFAQVPTNSGNKTIIFSELTSYVEEDGTITQLKTNRVVMNGTNEELMKQFPDVLKAFYAQANDRPVRIRSLYQIQDKGTATVSTNETADQAAIDNF